MRSATILRLLNHTERRWAPLLGAAVAVLLAVVLPARVADTPDLTAAPGGDFDPVASSSAGDADDAFALGAGGIGGGSGGFGGVDAFALGAPIEPAPAPGEEAPDGFIPPAPEDDDLPPLPDTPDIDVGPLGPVMAVPAPFATPLCGGLGVIGFVLAVLPAAGVPLDSQLFSTIVFTACGLIPLPPQTTVCPLDFVVLDTLTALVGDLPIPRPTPAGHSVDSVAAMEALIAGEQLGVAAGVAALMGCETT